MKKYGLVLAMFLPLTMYSQAFLEISGRVKVHETQEPLEGCHVYINESFGTISDEEGYFKLMVPSPLVNEILRVRYMGFTEFRIPIYDLDQGFLDIALKEDAIKLEPVVVYADPWDPWDEFREAVQKLSEVYPDKEELLREIMNELQKMHPGLTGSTKMMGAIPGFDGISENY